VSLRAFSCWRESQPAGRGVPASTCVGPTCRTRSSGLAVTAHDTPVSPSTGSGTIRRPRVRATTALPSGSDRQRTSLLRVTTCVPSTCSGTIRRPRVRVTTALPSGSDRQRTSLLRVTTCVPSRTGMARKSERRLTTTAPGARSSTFSPSRGSRRTSRRRRVRPRSLVKSMTARVASGKADLTNPPAARRPSEVLHASTPTRTTSRSTQVKRFGADLQCRANAMRGARFHVSASSSDFEVAVHATVSVSSRARGTANATGRRSPRWSTTSTWTTPPPRRTGACPRPRSAR
jgi:hypothetical protein